MRRPILFTCALASGIALTLPTIRAVADEQPDFGLFIAHQLREHSEQLFGFERPLESSAAGPYDGIDNTRAIEVAQGLRVSLVSSSVASATDQIALWPNDDRPTHLFVCDEETTNPAVQMIDLSKPARSNATTIVSGLESC